MNPNCYSWKNKDGHSAFARQSGLSLVTAIFLLVILASLGAFIVRVSTTQHMTSALDVQGSRAYHAARAGVEWGLYQILDPANTTVQQMVPPYGTGTQAWPNLPACPSSTTMTIEGFSVQVNCVRYPGSGVYNEAGTDRSITVYELTSTASTGVAGGIGFVERQVAATVSKCRALYGAPPGYAC